MIDQPMKASASEKVLDSGALKALRYRHPKAELKTRTKRFAVRLSWLFP
jgi:hypothetical protein